MDKEKIKDFILSVLFTKKCKFCLNVCDIRKDICEECEKDIHPIKGEICSKCGCQKDYCDCSNRGRFQYYESIYAPFYYNGALKKAVHHFKFHNKPNMAESLSQYMADCFNEKYINYDFDICTFVPSYKADEKKRGYNQSQLLAESLCEKINIPCKKLLNKDFKTLSQHNLPEALRSGNLVGSISFNEKENINIENMRILLCDDVKTSGETLNECAKTLLINGACEVRCLTLCITKKQKNS